MGLLVVMARLMQRAASLICDAGGVMERAMGLFRGTGPTITYIIVGDGGTSNGSASNGSLSSQ